MEVTPLTLLVAMLPPVVKELLDMTVEVATTPLTVVVSTLPERLWVKLLMKLIILEEIPLMIEVKVLVVVETVLEFIMVAVADCIPFTVLERELVVVARVWEFTKLVEVVETTPFTLEVNMKLLVVVAMLRRLAIVVVGIEVVAEIPFITLVSIWVEVE